MDSQKRKRKNNYIFFRIYAPVIWVFFFIWVIFWLISVASDTGPSIIQVITFVVLFPFFGIAVSMLMSISVFPFEYSVFGSLERIKFPDERPILKKTGSWGAVGQFRATVPFFSWQVFSSGLGISIFGIGKVFIAAENIRELNDVKGMGLFNGPRYRLTHNSPELHSPVYLPDKQVFEALKSLQN